MISTCVAVSVAIASTPDEAPASARSAETWYVATNSGTRAMTLDDLDEALARGDVDTSTRVWIPGMAEWEALGDVANLEDGPPLECMPGKMLEYGLDAERAQQNDDGSSRPSVGDIRDYDPFSFPPPADELPDPNRALWASILPPAPVPSHTPVQLRIDPWWKADARMPWVGLILSGTFVLCLSLLGVARMLSSEPAEQTLHSATLSLQALPAPVMASDPPALAPAADSVESVGEAPTLVRYEEGAGSPTGSAGERKGRLDRAATRKAPPAVADKKRAARPAPRRP